MSSPAVVAFVRILWFASAPICPVVSAYLGYLYCVPSEFHLRCPTTVLKPAFRCHLPALLHLLLSHLSAIFSNVKKKLVEIQKGLNQPRIQAGISFAQPRRLMHNPVCLQGSNTYFEVDRTPDPRSGYRSLCLLWVSTEMQKQCPLGMGSSNFEYFCLSHSPPILPHAPGFGLVTRLVVSLLSSPTDSPAARRRLARE